jgi:hypothetical protein
MSGDPMQADCSKLWPKDGESPLTHWGFLAGKLGADPDLPRPFLICLRGVPPFAIEAHPNVARPGYNDAGILVYRGGQQVFPMSSVPYQTNSRESPDVNHDGVGDVGCIKTGRYVLTDKGIQPYPVFVLTNPDDTDKIACSRDLRHDGQIDHSGPAVYLATAVLMHTGADGAQLVPPSAHTSSIACQCANVRWLQFMRERARATGSGVIDYVLIDAADAVALFDDLAPEPFPLDPLKA